MAAWPPGRRDRDRTEPLHGTSRGCHRRLLAGRAGADVAYLSGQSAGKSASVTGAAARLVQDLLRGRKGGPITTCSRWGDRDGLDEVPRQPFARAFADWPK